MKSILAVGLTIGKLPGFILSSGRDIGADFLKDRAVIPVVIEDGRSRTSIGTVNKDHLADVVGERLHVIVDVLAVSELCTDVDNVLKVLSGKLGGFAQNLISDVVH